MASASNLTDDMKNLIRCIVLLGFVFCTGCQNVDEIEKPKHLLTKSEMKDLVYDMVLLDAAVSVDKNKLKKLDVEVLEFLSKKYDIDSTDLKQNITYYNLRFNESVEIYEHAKDSIETLKNTYDSISKAIDSLKKLAKKKLDSTETDSLIEAKVSLKN